MVAQPPVLERRRAWQQPAPRRSRVDVLLQRWGVDDGSGRVGPGLDDVPRVVLVFLGLAVVGTAPLVPWLADYTNPYERAFTVLHILVCALGAALGVATGLRPALVIASVFPYCWLVVPSVYQISHTAAAWGDPGVTLDDGRVVRAMGVLLLGQAALLMGYLVEMVRQSRSSSASPDAASTRSRPIQLTHRTTWLLAWALLGLAVVTGPLALGALGGTNVLFSSRAEASASDTAGGLATLIRIPSAASSAAAILLLARWHQLRQQGLGPERRATGRLAVVAVLLTLLIANPFINPRALVLAAYGGVAVALLRPRRVGWAALFLLSALVSFLLVYPLANYFRAGNQQTIDRATFATPDFDGFQQTINAIGYVAANGLGWGAHLLSGIFFFVPRAIWHAKAAPSTFEVAAFRGYDFQNLSMPFPAEVYLDLSWVGVVLVMGAIGVAWAKLDRSWLLQSAGAVLSGYLAIAQVSLWRGPFLSTIPFYGPAVVFLAIALITARRETTRAAATPSRPAEVARTPARMPVRGLPRPPRGAR